MRGARAAAAPACSVRPHSGGCAVCQVRPRGLSAPLCACHAASWLPENNSFLFQVPTPTAPRPPVARPACIAQRTWATPASRACCAPWSLPDVFWCSGGPVGLTSLSQPGWSVARTRRCRTPTARPPCTRLSCRLAAVLHFRMPSVLDCVEELALTGRQGHRDTAVLLANAYPQAARVRDRRGCSPAEYDKAS